MKKILGMGNALVDVMIPVDNENILAELELPKGSMQLVDRDRSDRILSLLQFSEKSHSAGGSAANTIHGIASLGAPTGYIGVIGEDEMGGFFVRDMINAGVEPHLIHSTQETGRAIALVTPDSERTFATFLGAAIELSAKHLSVGSRGEDTGESRLSPDIFKKYDFFHIEGYLVQNHELIEKAVRLAKENNLLVSVDLASYNVVEANRDFLDSVIGKYVDIVFANEEEAKAFTGKEPEEALDDLGKICEIAVVKTGSKGSLVKKGNEIIRIGVIPVNPVDTTGAGDLYAAGFLFGLASGMTLQQCGETGALLAGNVIEVIGSKMSGSQWEHIHNLLRIK
jgi:sugar/nucleoside kinase (ribokinase family)